MKRLLLVVLVVALAIIAYGFSRWTVWGREVRFMAGGALVDAGYGLQDPIEAYDFDHRSELTPQRIWQEVLEQNQRAAAMRGRFPRTPHHPLVALVVCMDSRIDTNELVGDTRHYYYVIRTAGSVMSEREEEMLELAVNNGVKLIVLTTHSDCAAEKTAASPAAREGFPALAAAVDEREARVEEFLRRPRIARALSEGRLLVKRATIETRTDRLLGE